MHICVCTLVPTYKHEHTLKTKPCKHYLTLVSWELGSLPLALLLAMNKRSIAESPFKCVLALSPEEVDVRFELELENVVFVDAVILPGEAHIVTQQWETGQGVVILEQHRNRVTGCWDAGLHPGPIILWCPPALYSLPVVLPRKW